MLKKLFFIFVLVALMLSGCESEKIEEATENSTELKEENTTEYRIINRERTLDTEEFLTNKGDVSVTRYVYSTIVDSQTYYDYEYYVWVEGQKSQIPIESPLSEDTEISIVKLTKEYVIIFVDEEFQLIKYRYKDKEFDLLIPKNNDIKDSQYSIDMRDYWWIENQTGYYFNIETEDILNVENVINKTITFPGFYVEDPNRGIDTQNGVIISLVDVSEDQLKREAQYKRN